MDFLERVHGKDIAALDNLPQTARAIDPDWGPDWD